jgi:hypothetical protein
VTTLLDAGPGSLRDAIATTPAGGTVDFQPGLSGTITLASGELAINQDMTIAGPGAGVITVSGNHASRVFNIAATFTVDILGLTIADGLATFSGGGIYNAGTLNVSNCTVSGDSGSGGSNGGGIYNAGTLTVSASNLADNFASQAGGGIFNNGGTLTINHSTVSSNTARGSNGGGGLYNFFGTLTVSNCTFSGNSGNGGGGLVNFDGTGTVCNCNLSGLNSGGAGNGGGILSSGDGATLTVSNCTVSGNLATFGGGIYIASGTLTVSNCTLSGNAAGSGGGGMYIGGGTLTVSNCTLSGNSSGTGGGIFNSGGTLTVSNSIIASNGAVNGPDLFGNATSLGHNLIGDATGGSGYDPTDLVGTASNPIDPLLGPLQDNGGPTPTKALLPGSPALNAGDPSQLGVADQRGVVRSGGVNIGAYQASASALVLTAPDTVMAGTPFSITVQARDPLGQTAVGYAGTVGFTASNGATATYTFTTADAGQHTFGNLVLRRAQTLTVTGTDSANPAVNGNVTFTNTPAAADDLAFTVSAPVTAGVPFAITVTVQDAYGNTVTDYTGTVHFTAYLGGDQIASRDYTFTASDVGQHTFAGLVLNQPADYTITGEDPLTGISGSVTFPVDPA